jgi:DNA polymerase-3 subunit alpha
MCDSHPKKFVQIHCHSDASMLDGAASVDKLVKRAKEYGHSALCLTDHGNPSGLFNFARQCKKNGIKPILGLEFYITNDLRSRVSHKNRETVEDRDYHQSVYIKDKEGYLNFNYLTYQSFTEGYYYKPRIDFDLLFERKKGLMVTSSCMASKTSNYIRLNQHKDAEDLFKKYLKEFGDDFYGEIQFNEVPGQKEINDFIIHACHKYDVPLLIGGDVHYLNPGDNVLQDALIRSKRDNENSDWTISARKLYFHDTGDYMKFNKELGWNYDETLLEQCFENSIKFSEKANFEFETGKYHFPKINTKGVDSHQYLTKLVYEGAEKKITTRRKYGEEISDELIDQYTQRIEYELEVVKRLGVSDYFLMVHDIIHWEKSNGFYVGPGRGSVAGAVLAYFLDISSLCPIKHNLLFERFINPERKCITENNYILLKNGFYKKIVDLNIDDEPQTPKGEGKLLEIIMRQVEPSEQILEIELENGEIIEITSNHIIPVLRDNKLIEIKAIEITENDFLISF